jgi:NADH-quinone oxidoreductase subunit N
MAAFLLIDLLQPKATTELVSYEGLGKKNMWISGVLTAIMVALAGLPPTVGFTAKWLIFSSLWDSYHDQGFPWMLWLMIGGILNAAIALAYYLRIPYLLFFKNSNLASSASNDSTAGKVIAGILLSAVVLLFFNPEWIMRWISAF